VLLEMLFGRSYELDGSELVATMWSGVMSMIGIEIDSTRASRIEK
jgi:hypothetical protein